MQFFNGKYYCEWYNSSIESPMITEYIREEIIKKYEIIKLVEGV